VEDLESTLLDLREDALVDRISDDACAVSCDMLANDDFSAGERLRKLVFSVGLLVFMALDVDMAVLCCRCNKVYFWILIRMREW